jgi:hypothetical protein
MAVKYRITAAEFEALSDALKGEYKQNGDNYVLDVSDMEDTGALKRAKDREAQARQDAERELAELKARQAQADDDSARNRGDIDALTQSYEQKLFDAKAASDARAAKDQAFISETLIGSAAQKLASEISTSPELIIPHIKGRLTVDTSGENPTVRVLDSANKVSAASLEDLGKEFVDNKSFAPIIKASDAQGAGGPGTNTGQDGGAGQSPQAKPDTPLHEMSNDALIAHVKAKREGNSEE